jgi:hypothetical protein
VLRAEVCHHRKNRVHIPSSDELICFLDGFHSWSLRCIYACIVYCLGAWNGFGTLIMRSLLSIACHGGAVLYSYVMFLVCLPLLSAILCFFFSLCVLFCFSLFLSLWLFASMLLCCYVVSC